mgnify:CR=1 FL=1
MAEPGGEEQDSPYATRQSVIRASKVAVSLLRCSGDGKPDLEEVINQTLFDTLETEDLLQVVAVQNLWLLEQMGFIQNAGGGSVDDQLIMLGLNVAQEEAFGG